MSKDTVDVSKLRVQLAEFSPDDVKNCLRVLLQASAEHARELRLTVQEFAELSVEAWADAHDKTVTHFETTEESMGVQAVVGLAAKWRAS